MIEWLINSRKRNGYNRERPPRCDVPERSVNYHGRCNNLVTEDRRNSDGE
jgi:hypothetical protein